MRSKRRAHSGSRWYRVWKSKGFVLFLFVVVVFMGVSVTKEIVRRLETKHEIQKLEQEVARLSSRNQEASSIIAFFNTSTFQEKEARKKLGMQQPGEHVIVFPGKQSQPDIILPDSDKIQYIPLRDYQSNPEKWFYFFWDKINNTT